MTIRTRFAPSPTGYLHIGGARTALYSWLHARQNNGKFVLRVEDTDQERSTEASVQAILDGMDWLGLDYDEGPFFQTQRMDRYHEVIEQLLADDKAYYCCCSRERLDALREEQMQNKQKPRYDGHCRHLSISADDPRPKVLRFRTPEEGVVVIQDAVKGEVVVNNSELDDLILARTDGMPTYNLSVVVDDWDMQITHVIRGDDHLNNTPRQIHIYQALGADLPVFAHVPMILGDDGKRLSKRHGAVSVLQYRDEGYLPEALLNYLVRLGWSLGDQEIFSMDELRQHFALGDINRAASTYNPQKLQWLNQQYLKSVPLKELLPLVVEQLQKQGVAEANSQVLEAVLEVYRERCKTLVELAESIRYFFVDFDAFEAKAAKKNFKATTLPVLEHLQQQFTALEQWDSEALHKVIESTCSELDLKMGKVGQPLRVAVTGVGFSPAIDLTLELLGKPVSLQRLQKAIAWIREQGH